MILKNKYIYRSRISEPKFRNLVRYFALDLEARKIAFLTGLSVNTVNRYLLLLRQRLARACERPGSAGEMRLTGDGAWAVGIMTDDGTVQTRIVPAHRPGVFSARPLWESTFPQPVTALVVPGAKRLQRVPPRSGPAESSRCVPDEADRFWSFARTRLMKFCGVPRSTFYLHLKECEFRYNHRREDLYRLLLKMLRDEPLNL